MQTDHWWHKALEGEIALAAGDKPAARAEYARFLQFWKEADTDGSCLAASIVA